MNRLLSLPAVNRRGFPEVRVSLEHVIEVEDIDALCEALTETIADDIPSIEEEDARDDDFDNHPLCPNRDALVDVSPNFGGNAPDL